MIAIVLFCVFSFFLKGFLSPNNILTLLRSVSTLGILGVGMAIVVIGRGIDLTIVTIYAMSAAWTLHLANTGPSIPLALALGYLFALAVGVMNGVLIAYRRDPRSLRHPGRRSVRLCLRPLLPRPSLCGVLARKRRRDRLDRRRLRLWRSDADPVFRPVAALGFAFLRFTKQGRFIYALGDNFAAARISGAPVRPVVVLQYAVSATVAYLAGLITATAV